MSMLKRGLALLLALLMIGGTMSTCFAEGIARRPIPDNEAMAFLQSLGMGWNLGNTFDAIKSQWNKNADEMTVETSWGVPPTSENLFDALKAAGFSTVRIPVSWHDHVFGADHVISERWLARVQQVVDWALARDLYVILNIHHDEDQFLPTTAHYEASAHYISCIWQQLAERFRDYDEHLIFNSMNEPRIVGSPHEWYIDHADPACVDAIDCINRLNQLFVDTVRATGGGNATRWLLTPGYDASPEGALDEGFLLPQDPASRVIVSVHAYRPYPFALEIGGLNTFGSTQQKQEIVQFMNKLYDRYIANGIPAMIDEFGAMNKENLQDRLDWAAFYVATASARNLPCCWWDNGAFQGNGELFGLLDRKKAEIVYPELLEVLMTYGGYEKLPEFQP